MDKNAKQMIIGATMFVAGAGLFVANVVHTRKQEALRQKRIDESTAAWAQFNDALTKLQNDLSKRVENARFWQQVTTDFPEH